MATADQVQALIALAEHGDALVPQMRAICAQIQAAEDALHRALANEALAAASQHGGRPSALSFDALAGGRRLAHHIITQIERQDISGDPSAADLARNAYASITGA